jgi:hypothetical protein
MAPVRDMLADLTGRLGWLGSVGRWARASQWRILAASLVGWAWLGAAGGGRGIVGLCVGSGPIGRLVGEWRAGILGGQMVGCLLMSLAMTVAMMLPLTIDAQR